MHNDSTNFGHNMLIRADAPIMGSLWEYVIAKDMEIG